MAFKKKTAGQTADGREVIMDKLHVGFSAQIGADKYQLIKDEVKPLIKEYYGTYSDSELVLSIAEALNPAFIKARTDFQNGLKAAEDFIKANNAEDIAEKVGVEFETQ